ncbi:MAG: prolipoprotein diacylglyceryl transferase [Rikenellaceae bacterium]|nr:prolipoprotein diacylglyceryl transferase [Rikenellaceae bacterium]
MLSFISNYITWDVDPAIFTIAGREIRYYALLWTFSIIVGWYLMGKMIKKEGKSEKVLDSIFWYGVISIIIGARLGHVFFYEAEYYLTNPYKILYIWEGGLASHGAAIGLLIGLWLFSRKNKLPYIWSLDRIGIPVAIGGAAVRIGNLFNSEIYGTVTEKPWGFIFVQNGETLPMHPTQIYEAIAYLIIFVILLWMYFRKDLARKIPGLMFGFFLVTLFASRFFIEFVKNPQEDFEQNMLINMGQILSLPFIIVGIYLMIRAILKYNFKNKKK